MKWRPFLLVYGYTVVAEACFLYVMVLVGGLDLETAAIILGGIATIFGLATLLLAAGL